VEVNGFDGVQGATASTQPQGGVASVECARIAEGPDSIGLSAYEICVQLAMGDPSIKAKDQNAIDECWFLVAPTNLSEEVAKGIVRGVRWFVELPAEEKKDTITIATMAQQSGCFSGYAWDGARSVRDHKLPKAVARTSRAKRPQIWDLADDACVSSQDVVAPQ